jgi:hypothetical protein
VRNLPFERAEELTIVTRNRQVKVLDWVPGNREEQSPFGVLATCSDQNVSPSGSESRMMTTCEVKLKQLAPLIET